MSDWNSELYLRFEKERTQPAIDLANRVRGYAPRKIADIGCGPGNSTAVLRSVFPDAKLLGIDNSPNMIKKARASHPELSFEFCDVHELGSGYDLLYSNACLQWVPEHQTLLPELMGKLASGGVLAVQIPVNTAEPLFQIIAEVAADPTWKLGGVYFETNETLTSDEYFDVLSGCASDFQMWETIYCHALPSHQALVDWVKGSRLRPYLDALEAGQAAAFEKEIVDRVVKTYPIQKSGEVLLHFRRLFFVAEK